MVPLGFALELPTGWEGHLAPRSSTFKTWGIIQTNSVGVVDDTYIGDNDQWHMPVYCLEAKNENQIKGYQVKTAIPKYRFALKQNNGFYDSISKKDNFAYLQMNKCLDIVSVKSEIGSYSNFITRPLVMSLFIPKDIKKVDFGKYLQSFFKKINEQNIENLIIDLSYNTGGDFRLGKQLIWYLTDKEPKGFTEYIHNSEFYKKTVKNDYKK